jgi:hypothetical protein
MSGLDRKVVGPGIQAAQGREVGREVGVNQLKDALGAGEVAKTTLSEITQLHALGQVAADQHLRRRR